MGWKFRRGLVAGFVPAIGVGFNQGMADPASGGTGLVGGGLDSIGGAVGVVSSGGGGGFQPSALKTYTVTFDATPSDGWLRQYNAVYATAHDSATGLIIDTATQFTVWNIISAGLYNIGRTALFFNTLPIPLAAIIDSAYLSLRRAASSSNFGIYIVNGGDLNDPLIVSDFGALLDEVTALGEFNCNDIPTDSYGNVNFNPVGLPYIIKGGTTKIALRCIDDIDSVVPTGALVAAVFWANEKGVGYIPRLTVTYRA